jgi:hypothetical protein
MRAWIFKRSITCLAAQYGRLRTEQQMIFKEHFAAHETQLNILLLVPSFNTP